MISRILLDDSLGILLFLGGVHLAYTAFTHKFNPTDGQPETTVKRPLCASLAKPRY